MEQYRKYEVDILDSNKFTAKEWAEIIDKYSVGTNIIAQRGDGYVHLFWNKELEINNLCFDDCQVPSIFMKDKGTMQLIFHILRMKPNKLVIIYLDEKAERYIKEKIDKKNLKTEKVKITDIIKEKSVGFI
jgi:hypothetical protein